MDKHYHQRHNSDEEYTKYGPKGAYRPSPEPPQDTFHCAYTVNGIRCAGIGTMADSTFATKWYCQGHFDSLENGNSKRGLQVFEEKKNESKRAVPSWQEELLLKRMKEIESDPKKLGYLTKSDTMKKLHEMCQQSRIDTVKLRKQAEELRIKERTKIPEILELEKAFGPIEVENIQET